MIRVEEQRSPSLRRRRRAAPGWTGPRHREDWTREAAPMIDAPDRPIASDTGPEPEPGATPKKRGGGPKTAAGKESSKRNSLQHGLMAKVVLPDDLAAAVAARTAAL